MFRDEIAQKKFIKKIIRKITIKIIKNKFDIKIKLK